MVVLMFFQADDGRFGRRSQGRLGPASLYSFLFLFFSLPPPLPLR